MESSLQLLSSIAEKKICIEEKNKSTIYFEKLKIQSIYTFKLIKTRIYNRKDMTF